MAVGAASKSLTPAAEQLHLGDEERRVDGAAGRLEGGLLLGHLDDAALGHDRHRRRRQRERADLPVEVCREHLVVELRAAHRGVVLVARLCAQLVEQPRLLQRPQPAVALRRRRAGRRGAVRGSLGWLAHDALAGGGLKVLSHGGGARAEVPLLVGEEAIAPRRLHLRAQPPRRLAPLDQLALLLAVEEHVEARRPLLLARAEPPHQKLRRGVVAAWRPVDARVGEHLARLPRLAARGRRLVVARARAHRRARRGLGGALGRRRVGLGILGLEPRARRTHRCGGGAGRQRQRPGQLPNVRGVEARRSGRVEGADRLGHGGLPGAQRVSRLDRRQARGRAAHRARREARARPARARRHRGAHVPVAGAWRVAALGRLQPLALGQVPPAQLLVLARVRRERRIHR
eukprot:scaffold69124_cov65-Phaeocystis_antarctica.AAC.1